MKHLITITTLAVLCTATSHAQLRITALFDGPLGSAPRVPATETTPEIPPVPGRPRGIELFASEDIANLRDFGLNVASHNDTTPGRDIRLPNVSLAAGQFFYVSREEDLFEDWFGFQPDLTVNLMNQINGTFALELYNNDLVIDVFGDVTTRSQGSDRQPWDFVDSWVYRKSGTGPDGTTFDIENWIMPGRNSLDNESLNASANFPMPVGSYTPFPTASDTAPGAAVPEPSTYGIIFSVFAVGMIAWRKKFGRRS